MQNVGLQGTLLLEKMSKGVATATDRLAQGDYGEREGEGWWIKANMCSRIALEMHRQSLDDEDSQTLGQGDLPAAWSVEPKHSQRGWSVEEALRSFREAADLVGVQLRQKVGEDTAEFCYSLLEQKVIAADEQPAIARLLVQTLLKAIGLGSQRAQLCFPRLLVVVREFPAAHEAMRECSDMVPSTAFLPWTCQIISRIHTSADGNTALVHILARLARDYPNAVYYPFSLSVADFQASALREVSEVQDALKLVTPVLEQFVRAVDLLGDPWNRLKDWLEEAEPAVIERDRPRFCQLMKEMMADCFTPDELVLGTINHAFARCKLRACSDYRHREFRTPVLMLYTWRSVCVTMCNRGALLANSTRSQ